MRTQFRTLAAGGVGSCWLHRTAIGGPIQLKCFALLNVPHGRWVLVRPLCLGGCLDSSSSFLLSYDIPLQLPYEIRGHISQTVLKKGQFVRMKIGPKMGQLISATAVTTDNKRANPVPNSVPGVGRLATGPIQLSGITLARGSFKFLL